MESKPHPENFAPDEVLHTPDLEQEEKVSSIIELVAEINKSGERLTFPGVNQASLYL